MSSAQAPAQFYEQMLEAAGYVLVTLDPDYIILAASPLLQALVGTTLDELIHRSYFDLFELAWRGDVQQQIANTGQQYLFLEAPLFTPDGEQRWVEQVIAQMPNGSLQVMLRDITIRVRAQQEIYEREWLYRTLARSLPDTSVFLFDYELRCLIAEGTAAELRGYSGEPLEGRTMFEVLPSVLIESLEPVYRAALNGEIRSIEYEIEEVTYRLYGAPAFNDRDEIFAGMLVAQDITKAKMAEAALRHSEQRMRALLETIPDLIFVMNRQGVYVEFESRSVTDEHHLLLSPEQIVGTSIYDTGLSADIARRTAECLEQAVTTGQMQTFTYPINTPDGQRFYEARFCALNDEEVMVMVRNITALTQTQQELKSRVDQLTVLSDVEAELADQLNVDYVLTMALDVATRLSEAHAGFIAIKEGEPMRVARVVGAYSLSAVEQALKKKNGFFARILAEQTAKLIPDVSTEVGYIRLLPNTQAQIVIPLYSQNTLIGVLNLETRTQFTEAMFDFLNLVTTRIAVALDNARLYRQAADQLGELRRLYDQVSKLEQLKTDMIRVAAHDLRNPLATILGYLQLLRPDISQIPPASAQDYIANIETAARQMRKITSDILSLERIEEAAASANIMPFDFKKLVEQRFAEQRATAALKRQQFTLETAEAVATVQGDSVQLGEAVSNLITNAIKYTPDSGQIVVRLTWEPKQVIFEVVDNGSGIRESQQARLFQPFYRARSPETRDVEGTGLGLHLVKNIVERHGGTIRFHSVYQQGSTFGFTLPLSST